MSDVVKVSDKIVMLPVKDLRPYKNNPRINDGAVEPVAQSILKFGFRNPIVVNKEYVIIAGHTRMAAAKKLGLKTVPVIIVDGLTTEEENALRLADNKTAEIAVWDEPLLKEELKNILTIDMAPFGFEEIPITDDESKGNTEIIEDEPPEPPITPTTKAGEVYRLGNHILMCGDANSPKDMDKLIKYAGGE